LFLVLELDPPIQSLVVLPTIAALKEPLVPQWEIYEWTVEEGWEILNGFIVENNHQSFVLHNATGYAGYVRP
jgi:hypothetical protein